MNGIHESQKLESAQSVNQHIGTGRKECFKCGKEKPLTEFYKHLQMSDGRLNKCKECTKKDVSQNYRKNREYYAEYERQRYQENGRRQRMLEYQKNKRKRYPEKYRAMTAANNAVRDGRLTKKPCEHCGNPESQAHHPDYSKPLEVVWLCRACHLAEHGKVAYPATVKKKSVGGRALPTWRSSNQQTLTK